MIQIPFEIIRVKYNHPNPFHGDKVTAIIYECCMYFDVNEYQLKKRLKKREVTLARHIAISLIRQYCPMYSLKGIASLFNHKCHTTCLHSINEVKDKLKTNPEDPLSIAYYSITQKLPFLLNNPTPSKHSYYTT